MNFCKGECEGKMVRQIKTKDSSMYALGYKNCKQCGGFLKTSVIFCECCGTKLRVKPKTKREKEVYERCMKNLSSSKIEGI